MKKNKSEVVQLFPEIDQCALLSHMSRWRADFKVGVGLGSLLLCLMTNRPLLLIFVLLSMVFSVIGAGGIKIRTYMSLFLIPAAFALMGCAAIGVEVSWEAGLRLYTERARLLQALLIALRAFACVSCTYFFVLTTPVTEVIDLLVKCHMPAVLAELMHLVYRFIFILLKVYARMDVAARSRLGYRDYRTSLRSFGLVGANLLGGTLKNVDQYYNAMLSRGYTGRLRLLQAERRQPLWSWGALALYCILLLVIGCVL